MAQQILKKQLNLLPRSRGFTKRFTESNIIKKDAENLRKLISKEKIRIIYTIKNKSPESIYELSKILNKDFKSVHNNIKFLEKLGIISLKKIKKGNRTKLKPILTIKRLDISLNF